MFGKNWKGYRLDSMGYFMMSSKTLKKSGKKIGPHFRLQKSGAGFS
jgi:hypothetical protein